VHWREFPQKIILRKFAYFKIIYVLGERSKVA
jgi:hypothetical protein